MKLTVNQLRRIIKEEVQNVVAGQGQAPMEFLVGLGGQYLPPSYSDIPAAEWRKTLAKFKKIATNHGVKFVLTGAMTHNPDYKTMPTFQTEEEAQALEADLQAAGFDCYVLDVEPGFWN